MFPDADIFSTGTRRTSAPASTTGWSRPRASTASWPSCAGSPRSERRGESTRGSARPSGTTAQAAAPGFVAVHRPGPPAGGRPLPGHQPRRQGRLLRRLPRLPAWSRSPRTSRTRPCRATPGRRRRRSAATARGLSWAAGSLNRVTQYSNIGTACRARPRSSTRSGPAASSATPSRRATLPAGKGPRGELGRLPAVVRYVRDPAGDALTADVRVPQPPQPQRPGASACWSAPRRGGGRSISATSATRRRSTRRSASAPGCCSCSRACSVPGRSELRRRSVGDGARHAAPAAPVPFADPPLQQRRGPQQRQLLRIGPRIRELVGAADAPGGALKQANPEAYEELGRPTRRSAAPARSARWPRGRGGVSSLPAARGPWQARRMHLVSRLIVGVILFSLALREVEARRRRPVPEDSSNAAGCGRRGRDERRGCGRFVHRAQCPGAERVRCAGAGEGRCGSEDGVGCRFVAVRSPAGPLLRRLRQRARSHALPSG